MVFTTRTAAYCRKPKTSVGKRPENKNNLLRNNLIMMFQIAMIFMNN